MVTPPNFRKINDYKLRLNKPDNPDECCANCYGFTSVSYGDFDFGEAKCKAFGELSSDFQEVRSVFSSVTCDCFLSKDKFPALEVFGSTALVISLFVAIISSIIIFFLSLPILQSGTFIGLLLFVMALPYIAVFIMSFKRYKRMAEIEQLKKDFIESAKKRLEGTYNIPFTKVYETFKISKQDLVEILSNISNKYYDISDTEILVNNSTRAHFLRMLNQICLKKEESKQQDQMQLKLEDQIIKQPTIKMQEKPKDWIAKQSATVICERCGEEMQTKWKVCPACGNQMRK